MASQQDVQRYINASVALYAAKDEVRKAEKDLQAANGMIGATVWQIMRTRVEVLQPTKRGLRNDLDLTYHFNTNGGRVFVQFRTARPLNTLVIQDSFPVEWLCDPGAVEAWVKDEQAKAKVQRREELLKELALLEAP